MESAARWNGTSSPAMCWCTCAFEEILVRGPQYAGRYRVFLWEWATSPRRCVEELSQILKRMEAEAPHVKVTYKVGERVRIVDGQINDFRGTGGN